MKDIRVGTIRLRDIPQLRRQFEVAANSSFAYLEPDHRQQVIRDNNLARLTMAWAHPNRVLLGAWNDRQLLGYVIGSIQGNSANLYWLYVDPNSRGQNVGLRLLSCMRRVASSKGVTALVLATYDHQPFYARQGFKVIDHQHLHGKPMDIMALQIGNND